MPPADSPPDPFDGSDPASEAWRSSLPGIPLDVDLSTALVSSIDLLDLELELRRRTGRIVRLDSIEGPITLDSVRAAIATAPEATDVPRGRPDDGVERANATPAQQGQWLAERLRPGHRGYLVPLVVDLPEGTSWRRLSEAIRWIVAAHPSLRTRIEGPDGPSDATEQVVTPAPRMVVVEPRGVPDLGDDSIRSIIDGIGDSFPSVIGGRPWRAFGLQVDGRLVSLLLLVHHVAVDDPSLRIIVEDLHRLLDMQASADPDGHESIGVLDLAPGPGSASGSGDDVDEDLRWWIDELEGLPGQLDFRPIHEPAGRSRRRGARLDRAFVESLDRRLPDVGGTRSAAVLLSIRRALSAVGCAGEGAVPVGVPVSLRDDPGLERTTGMFLNTIPVPVDDAASIAEVLARFRECRRRRGVPYDRIVRGATNSPMHASGRPPWLDLVVGMTESDRRPESPLSWRVAPSGDVPFPAFVMVDFGRDGCRIELDVDPLVVDADTADRLLAAFVDGLRRLARDEPTGSAASRVVGPDRNREGRGPLDEILRNSAAATPEAPAVVDAAGTLSHAELDRLVDGLAGELLHLGSDGPAGLDRPVAVVGDGGREVMIAVAAAMRAGGAAMPIATGSPIERVSGILSRARPVAVIVDGESNRPLVEAALRDAALDAPIIDASRATPAESPVRVEFRPDAPCYILFTSGSTGEPKAVRMHHAGLAGLLDHERRRTNRDVAARTAQFAPIGFDVFFQEMFTTWDAGGAVVPVPLEVRRDAFALAAFLRDRAITRIHLPPLVLRGLAIACDAGFPRDLREIVCAGEALRIDEAIRTAAAGSTSATRLLNQYGPTETHVVTHHDLGDDPALWPDRPSIGGPIDGVSVRIESPTGGAVPVGESGELVVVGEAVALGYLDGDFGGFETPGDSERRYRTGDRARVGRDGRLEYLGRMDDQVKISGYRVDPTEIEAVLSRIEGVKDAAVVAASRDLDVALTGFVVGPSSDVALERCLGRLRDLLPPWLVPSRLRAIASIPRSSNGKVDREFLRREIDRLPRVEQGFAGGWSAGEVLGRLDAEPVRDDAEAMSLASLGIDSLAAIRLQAEFARRFATELPATTILRSSIEELRGRLGRDARSELVDVDGSRSDGSPAVPPIDSTGWGPLDALVRDVLAEEALAPEGAFHLAWTLAFDDDPGIEEIGRRIALIRRRFATLRTARRPDIGQRVLGLDELGPVDLEAFPSAPGEDDRRRLLRHPLRIGDGMPIRTATWPRADGGRDLLVVLHHAAVDGRTAHLILDDLVAGVPDDQPVVRQASSHFSDPADDAWWIGRVRDRLGEASLPVVEFDESARRDGAEDRDGGSVFHGAAEAAARLGLPPVVPAILAWALVLGRATNRDRVVIGVPFAGDVEESGLGASVLPIVVRIDDDRTVSEALEDVADVVAGGLDHRGATLGRIVREIEPDAAFTRPPLDGVLTRDDVARRISGCVVRWTSTGAGVFRAALVTPASPEGRALALDVESGVLDGERPQDMLARTISVLSGISTSLRVGDANRRRLGDIDCLTPAHRRLIRAFGTGGGDDEGTDRDRSSVSARFEAVARRQADDPAVVDADGSLAFGELESWSAAIASELLERCGPLDGRSVAIAGRRDAATIASMLGVVRAGGWFVPVDRDLPADRRERQLRACRPLAVLDGIDASSSWRGDVPVVDPRSFRGRDDARVDLPGSGPETPFYAMFTSGTTGEPRGAVVPHRAVLRLVDDAWFLPGGRGFRMLHAAPLAFDASTLEIWWPLLNGGTVCCWEESAADLVGLLDRIRRDGVRGCWLTAALFHAAVDGLPELFDGLDLVLTGGDVVSPVHVRRLLDRRPDVAIVNGYGPTENTVFTACESMVAGGIQPGSIPIGRPIRGTEVRIVDASERAVPPGRFGELVALGDGVGLGYLGEGGGVETRPGYFEDGATGRIGYRTGDRARWLPDGRLEFGGRSDAQVKVSGHRVELDAIDSTIRRMDGIGDACTIVLEDRERRIVASCVVPMAGRPSPSEKDVREWLVTRLPSWEVPAVVSVVEAIPRTANGKPDRRAVESILAATRDSDVLVPMVPRENELLDVVCRAIGEISGTPNVDPLRPIRRLGLDSLDLLRLAIELEKRVARPVRLVDVLEGGTARTIATRIAADIDREDASVVTLHPGADANSRALYCLPGVGGTVFSFQAILDGLPSWLPVRGLPYPGTAGRAAPLKRVEALADTFASRVLESSGVPAFLVGYSLGGFVAFEVARRLSAAGVDPCVMVIDSAPAGLPSRRSFAARVTNARDWKMRFRNVLPQGLLDRLGGGAGGTALESLRGVVAAGFEAMRFYDPEPAPVDVVLLRTVQTDFGPVSDLADLGWSELARTVKVVELPTSHLEVFRGGSMDLARVVRGVVESDRSPS